MITQAMASRPSRTPETSDRIIVVGLPSHLFRAGRGCQALLRGAARKRGCGCGNRALSAHDAGPRRHRFRFQGWFKFDGRRDAHFTCQRALGSTCVVALGRRLDRGKRIIGYWHWELPEVPCTWTVGFKVAHEIWVPSRFVAKSLSRINPGKPVRIMPHPVALRVPAPRAPRERNGRQFVRGFWLGHG
jgi:hypothetical protein